MDIQAIIRDCDTAKHSFTKKKAQYETLLENKDRLVILRDEKVAAIDSLGQARMLLAESSVYAKRQVKSQLENLVTSGLQYVFGDDRRFETDIVEGKTRTEAEFYVVKTINGEELREAPEDDKGGGVVDVVSLILRFAMLEAFSEPSLGGSLALDEPVKMVSDEFIPRIGEFLVQIKEYFGRQIIMSSHNMFLKEIGDTKYLVTMGDDGISHIEAVN